MLSISFTRVPAELTSRRPSATSEPECASAKEMARPNPRAAPVTRETCPVRLKSGNFTGISSLAKTVEKDEDECNGGSDGIEEGVPRRGRAADDKGLVDFIQRGVSGSDGKSEEGPRPAPAGAIATGSAEEEQIENEVLGEVSGLADEIMEFVNLMAGKRTEKPTESRLDDGAGVCGGKSVSGERENDRRPKQGRPPGAEPGGNERGALTDLVEFRSGARIAPGLFGQERISSRCWCGAKKAPASDPSTALRVKSGRYNCHYSMR